MSRPDKTQAPDPDATAAREWRNNRNAELEQAIRERNEQVVAYNKSQKDRRKRLADRKKAKEAIKALKAAEKQMAAAKSGIINPKRAVLKPYRVVVPTDPAQYESYMIERYSAFVSGPCPMEFRVPHILRGIMDESVKLPEDPAVADMVWCCRRLVRMPFAGINDVKEKIAKNNRRIGGGDIGGEAMEMLARCVVMPDWFGCPEGYETAVIMLHRELIPARLQCLAALEERSEITINCGAGCGRNAPHCLSQYIACRQTRGIAVLAALMEWMRSPVLTPGARKGYRELYDRLREDHLIRIPERKSIECPSDGCCRYEHTFTELSRCFSLSWDAPGMPVVEDVYDYWREGKDRPMTEREEDKRDKDMYMTYVNMIRSSAWTPEAWSHGRSIPGYGTWYESCGEIKYRGCSHGEVIIKQVVPHICKNLRCKKCLVGNLNHTAAAVADRINTVNIMKRSNTGYPVKASIAHHVTVSPDEARKDRMKSYEGEKGVTEEIRAHLEDLGSSGGAGAMHMYRYTRYLRKPYWSPHMHYILIGHIEDIAEKVSRKCAETGILFKWLRSLHTPYEVFGAARYIASHAAVRDDGAHTFKYHGSCSYNQVGRRRLMANDLEVSDDIGKMLRSYKGLGSYHGQPLRIAQVQMVTGGTGAGQGVGGQQVREL